MSLLPGQILPESVPFGSVDDKGKLYVDHNWYLFLYNLALQVLTANGNSTPVPASPYDLLDMADLDADMADVPQAYRQIRNLQGSQTDAADGADVATMLRQLVNAVLLAADGLLQDPPLPAGPVIPITPGASPFTYTAIHDGTFFVSGPPSATINIIRYGVTVPTGMTDGTIALRKNDQVSLTWSGGTAPIMNFLPNK